MRVHTCLLRCIVVVVCLLDRWTDRFMEVVVVWQWCCHHGGNVGRWASMAMLILFDGFGHCCLDDVVGRSLRVGRC